jgi:hypothetical protein
MERINKKKCNHKFLKEWNRNTKVCINCGRIELDVLHREVSEWGKGIWAKRI